MLTVPTSPVPSQTLAVTLNGQAAQLALRSNNGHLFCDLYLKGVPILLGRICRNQQRLLIGFEYRGFDGDFIFVDTQGESDPTFSGLGTRYQLVYLDASE